LTGRPQERIPPAGIPGSDLSGPFPVGAYAARLRARLREFARVQIFGEVWNLRLTRARVYFELRDSDGALPCSMWRADWEALGLPEGSLGDGAQVVVGGGCDFYPGSATSSPSFQFAVHDLRPAGEGDLLAQLARLRRLLDAEGLFEPQKRLARPALPRSIGVVTGEGGKARDDVLAGLRRQGWAGRLVWAFAPVQDRHAAPRIAQALRELSSWAQVDVIVVARGGGSLADLFAFCDEALCRTVALLPVPVIASVGHHTDRTLLDDVAAVSCSTPTHAAQSAVRVDCRAARAGLVQSARRLEHHGRAAVLTRAHALVQLSRAPAEQIARHRRRLHQQLRELRASARRRGLEERSVTSRRLLVLGRKAQTLQVDRTQRRTAVEARAADLARTAAAARRSRQRDLARLSLALAAHEPERTLQRGYALVEDSAGEPLASAQEARAARDVKLRFRDGRLDARVRDGT
jgi:exodeoxyribonuclease VII large subunit